MAKIVLTDTERLLLANQYEILGLLKQDKSYSQTAENLRNGHKWLYEQHATTISDNLPDAQAERVLSILNIYKDLKDSYQKLSDKSGIEPHLVTFLGFDGNNEADLRIFTQALTENGNYSETIGKTAPNSHMPTTDIYNKMIDAWQKIGKLEYPLSRDQIMSILGDRIHASDCK